jgi:DNA invertase Pin-like site-specific DNA recombinase
MRAAIYARVSTTDQTVDNQLLELRRYVDARGWTSIKRVCGCHLGRSLRHLVLLMEELQQLGVTLVSLGEGLDLSTPAGRLRASLLSAVAQFEVERIRERVVAGLRRARTQGKRLGRPRTRPALLDVPGGTVRSAAKAGGVSKTTAAKWIARGHRGQSPEIEAQIS